VNNEEKTTDNLAKYLLALYDMNKSLILGLETAIKVMKNGENYEQEQRDSVINGLEGMLKTAKKATEAHISVQRSASDMS